MYPYIKYQYMYDGDVANGTRDFVAADHSRKPITARGGSQQYTRGVPGQQTSDLETAWRPPSLEAVAPAQIPPCRSKLSDAATLTHCLFGSAIAFAEGGVRRSRLSGVDWITFIFCFVMSPRSRHVFC